MRRPFDWRVHCAEDVGERRFLPLCGRGRGIPLVVDSRMPKGKFVLVAPRRLTR